MLHPVISFCDYKMEQLKNDDLFGVHVATHPIGVDYVIQREIYCFKEEILLITNCEKLQNLQMTVYNRNSHQQELNSPKNCYLE